MKFLYLHSRSGFSILMALATIAILMIIVTGLATTYVREFHLSRTSYDEVIASASAEGAFEYGMLKIRNHPEGFADTLSMNEPDVQNFILSTPRSSGIKTGYKITANSSNSTFPLSMGNHLILPLFASNESTIVSTGNSKKPQYNSGTTKVQDLEIIGMGDAITWTIVAQSGSTSIGITGTGDINANTKGTVRIRSVKCIASDGSDATDCSTAAEQLQYFYDITGNVSDFLKGDGNTSFGDDASQAIKPNTADPYLMIYNNDTTDKSITIKTKANTPFALPKMSIEATAQKNDSLQTFRFIQDNSAYYDALKYGVYNTGN